MKSLKRKYANMLIYICSISLIVFSSSFIFAEEAPSAHNINIPAPTHHDPSPEQDYEQYNSDIKNFLDNVIPGNEQMCTNCEAGDAKADKHAGPNEVNAAQEEITNEDEVQIKAAMSAPPFPEQESSSKESNEQNAVVNESVPQPLPVVKSDHGSNVIKEEDIVQTVYRTTIAKEPSVGEMISRVKDHQSSQIVYDEGMQPVKISMKDITRMVCFTDIARVIYSKEKGIEIETEGQDAYIKNLPMQVIEAGTGQQSVKYDSRPKELYVICGSHTYSLILFPHDIPATTIYLKTSYIEKNDAYMYERATDYENMLLRLMKDIYKEDIPTGYEIENINQIIGMFNEGELIYRKKYIGDSYQVQEYMVKAQVPIYIDEIQIAEILQLSNPLAISIVEQSLDIGDQTRVFVVRRVKQ